MISKTLLIAALIFTPSWLGIESAVVNTDISESKSGAQNELQPEKISRSLGVKVTAESALAIDRKTGAVLFSKNMHEARAMASTTKVMTVLIALESGKDLNEVVTVHNDAVGLEGAKIRLENDEQLTFSDLIKGALVASGNDAALATALHTADGDLNIFLAMMNAKASELGLEDTHFMNPHGLDADNHYTTASDLAKIFSAALEYEEFKEMIATQKTEAHALNSETVHTYRNTNKLLTNVYPYMHGGKTGFTDNAGFCLVSLSGHGDEDEIITVVLGSDLNGNQFQDSKSIIEWAYLNYSWNK